MPHIWNCVYLTLAEYQSFAHNRNAASDRLKLKKLKVPGSERILFLWRFCCRFQVNEIRPSRAEVMTYFCFIVACKPKRLQEAFLKPLIISPLGKQRKFKSSVSLILSPFSSLLLYLSSFRLLCPVWCGGSEWVSQTIWVAQPNSRLLYDAHALVFKLACCTALHPDVTISDI